MNPRLSKMTPEPSSQALPRELAEDRGQLVAGLLLDGVRGLHAHHRGLHGLDDPAILADGGLPRFGEVFAGDLRPRPACGPGQWHRTCCGRCRGRPARRPATTAPAATRRAPAISRPVRAMRVRRPPRRTKRRRRRAGGRFNGSRVGCVGRAHQRHLRPPLTRAARGRWKRRRVPPPGPMPAAAARGRKILKFPLLGNRRISIPVDSRARDA